MRPVSKGFTIIELLVTISIIALLVAAAGIGINNARKTGRDAKRITGVLQLSQALDEQASLARGTYPVPTSAPNGVIQVKPGAVFVPALALAPLPGDPLPAETTCTPASYLCGITLYVRKGVTSENPAKPQAGDQYEYVIAAGLEREPIADDQSVTRGPGSASGRLEYRYFGKACGTAVAPSCTVL